MPTLVSARLPTHTYPLKPRPWHITQGAHTTLSVLTPSIVCRLFGNLPYQEREGTVYYQHDATLLLCVESAKEQDNPVLQMRMPVTTTSPSQDRTQQLWPERQTALR